MRRYLLICSTWLALAGCKDILNEEPPQNIPTAQALSSANDLESAANGAMQAVQADGALGGTMKIVPDIFSDIAQINNIAYERGVLVLYPVYQRNPFGSADQAWSAGYQAIERANEIIAAIDGGYVTAPDRAYEQNKDRLKGEALAIRGMMHFELCRLYAKQYGVQLDEEQSGVVLKTTPTVSRQGQPRATVREVYNQVIADLTQAAALLPEDYDPTIHPRSYGGRVGGRFTKQAARAILARVYFQMATSDNYQKAKALIDTVMGEQAGSPIRFRPTDEATYAQTFNKRNSQASPQTILQVVNAYNPQTNELSSTVGLIASAYRGSNFTQDAPDLGTAPAYVASGEFRENFQNLGNRGPLYEEKRGGASQYFVNKFLFIDGQPLVLNIPVIRGAELILTRAEINASLGNLALAALDVNYMHQYAGTTPLTVTNQEAALRDIRRERVQELAFEGDRLHDIRRRNQAERTLGLPDIEPDQVSPGGVRFQNGQQLKTNDFRLVPQPDFTSNDLLLVIPDAEIFTNPLVRRNP